jgi:hypothetical protein
VTWSGVLRSIFVASSYNEIATPTPPRQSNARIPAPKASHNLSRRFRSFCGADATGGDPGGGTDAPGGPGCAGTPAAVGAGGYGGIGPAFDSGGCTH